MLSCGDQEGIFVALTVSAQFLVAGTDCGFVKIWDLSRRYIHEHVHSTLYMYVNTACNAHIDVFSLSLYLCEEKQGFMTDGACLKKGRMVYKSCLYRSTVQAVM